MEINIDAKTKIITASDIRVKTVKGGEPLDFGRDMILILDPKTNRPVATCRPLAGAESAKSAVFSSPSQREPGAEPDGSSGPMTSAQRERLERLWTEHPNWPASKIQAEFAAQTGREISQITAYKYRPAIAEAIAENAPTPDEIARRAKAERLAKLKP